MRGKPLCRFCPSALYRITPAGAGKTLLFRLRSWRRWDHPRRCGENVLMLNDLFCTKGSPPQVRGKHGAISDTPSTRRITPAGAGKTNKYLSIGFWGKDHPRRCGENLPQRPNRVPFSGSPPQVRGKPSLPQIQPTCVRITPAGAGKTSISFRTNAFAEDHPRRCGENLCAVLFLVALIGSPPQVRGKRSAGNFCSTITRITPAGAGKTGTECAVYATDEGSPPQVRGKPGTAPI